MTHSVFPSLTALHSWCPFRPRSPPLRYIPLRREFKADNSVRFSPSCFLLNTTCCGIVLYYPGDLPNPTTTCSVSWFLILEMRNDWVSAVRPPAAYDGSAVLSLLFPEMMDDGWSRIPSLAPRAWARNMGPKKRRTTRYNIRSRYNIGSNNIRSMLRTWEENYVWVPCR